LTSTTGRKSNEYHVPVLAGEVIRLLVTRPDGIYLDLTCGGGGHLKELSKALAPEAVLIGVDRDPEAIAATGSNLESIPQTLKLVESSFARLEEVIKVCGVTAFNGILLDLGVSSHQLDAGQRGFAFMLDGPLDMRMGKDSARTAEIIVNQYSEIELTRLFRDYGEEKRARKAAAAIGDARKKGRITTTGQLRQVLEPVLPYRELNASLARIFQAIRIEVNDELGQLAEVLPKAIEYLVPGGHMVVIAYHSLEDRLVKRLFASRAKGCTCPPQFPVCVCGQKPSAKILTRKAVRPDQDEITRNSRAKSARLRAIEKIG
jgi:16S rRNA (cytosine1402-N4)-methyltransferase